MISRVVNHITAAIPTATAAVAKARTPIAELTPASASACAIGSAGVLRPKHSQLEHSQFSAVQGTPKVGPPSHPMNVPTNVVSPRFTQVLLNICACERPARYATKIAKSKAKEGREETSMLKEEELV